MSVIYITEHNENIYNVTEKPQKKYIKPARYISTFSKPVKSKTTKTVRAVTGKQLHATMGVPEVKLKNPKDYLRRRSGIKLETKETKKVQPRPTSLPQWDKEPKPKGKTEDFIKKNVNYIKKIKFHLPEPRYIDSRFGQSHNLYTSGLQPVYTINAVKFGRPPNYLLNIMRRHEYIEKKEKELKDIENLPKCRYVTRQEREELLTGLKLNWDQLQKEFQLLPIITDTIPKILKKDQLEKDLAQLEKDIILIEKHPYIYVDENVYSETDTNE